MNHSHQLRRAGRLWRTLGLLLGLLGLLPRAGQAQLYYTLNDGAATTATDQLRTSTATGASDAAVKTGAAQSPGALVLDAANNRLLVADTRATSSATANTKIVAVSLASGNATTTFLTPAYLANSTSTVVSGLALDATNSYLYYVLNDGNAATSTDQLRRIGLNGTGDVLLKSGFAQSPGALVLDAANNRLLVADTRATSSATANTKIVAVSLASGNAATTFLTPAYLANSTSTVVSGLALDATNSYLYYVLSDGSATASTDQLRRISLAGTGDVLVKTGFAQAPGALVLDAPNNQLVVADRRASTSGSPANTKIVAVSLASGNAVSTLLTPAYLSNSATTTVAGLTNAQAVAPTVTTAAATTIGSSSAVLGGTVTADGGATVTDRGVVYSTTNQTPTTSDTKDANGLGMGSYSKTIAGLMPSATYYVRAYATNSVGTSYGAVISFTTQAPVSGTTVVTNVSCNGGSNGTINLTPSGGLAPYTFLWNNGTTTSEDRTGLVAGTYTVTITDAAGATGTVNATVTQPSAIVGFTSRTNIACNGGSTGVASVSSVSGGTGSYTYAWQRTSAPTGAVAPSSGTATSSTITGLVAGTYTVTITDANGCTLTRSYTLTEASALTATTSQTNVTTTGGSDGSATITVGGGTPSYSYSWSSNVSTTATASNLSAGTYTVTVGDANNCTIQRTFTITQPAATAPTVTTTAAASVTSTSAVLGGNVTAANGATVTGRGVVYSSTNTTPTIGGTGVTQAANGSGTGTFAQTISGLTPGTSYSVQAYATNGAGTSYGGVQTFTTTAVAVATAQNVTVQLDASGNGTLTASSVNNGSTGSGTLTYTIQKIARGLVSEGSTLTLATANGTNFTAIRFASYGTPTDAGNGAYRLGSCNAANSVATAQNSFVGRSSGSMDAQNGPVAPNNTPQLGDPCGGTPKVLAVQAAYSANAASQTYVCSEAGKTQYVLLTVTDGNGSTSTAVATVTVNASPTATITSLNPTSGNIGATITVTGTNLSGATAAGVVVNGTPVTALSNASGTSFQFQVPSGTSLGAGNVVVTLPCGQSLSNAFTVTQPTTAAPVITAPANNSFTNQDVTFNGTAPASSEIVLYISQNNTAFQQTSPFNAAANGTFSLGPIALPDATYRVYATAQSPGASVSANSPTITFTVDTSRPSVAISSTAGASGGNTGTSPIPFAVTFSETVNGSFVQGDLTVTGGTIVTGSFSGSGAGPYTFSVTPSTSGSTVTVNVPANVAQDAAGNFNTAATSAYSLTFVAPTITVAPATLPGGTQNVAYSASFTASGGSGTYTYAITSGALPAGLTLTGNAISGTPTVNGSFNFRVTATDNAAAPGPYSGFRDYTLVIAAPASVTWTGTISTDWFTAGNWTPAFVPTATVDATIPTSPSGNRFPAVAAGTASARNLALNSGASLTQTGGTLALAGNLTNNGTYQPMGGTASLGSTALSNILGSSNTRFWNLTVGSSGAQSSTSAGTSVQRLFTLNGNFTTNGNPLTLESSAAATALVVNNGSNVVSGNVTVQRYIDASGNTGTSGYRHYASPVGNATVSSLSTSAYGGSFAAQVNALYNTADPNQLTLATYPNVFSYDESKIAGSPAVSFSDFDKGYQSPASLSDALTVGRGYAVQIGNTEKVQFTGPLNNSTQTISGLTYAASGTAGAASAGWALIGNPYPAPLDWGTVGAGQLSNVGGAAYVFQSTSAYAGRYTSYTNNVGAGTGLIASGQAFFVRASTPGTTGSVALNNANRMTGYANPAFQRTTAETRPLLRLSLALGSQPATVAMAQDETFVYFEAGATDGVDGKYDAYKLANPSGYYLGSVTPGTAPLGLSIDGRSPLAAATTTEIPLWVSLPAGTYTLTATEILNFTTLAGGTQVQLRDALLGTLTDLVTVPSHSFSVAANAPYAGRFSLVFRTSGVLATVPGTELALAKASLYPNPATSATALSVTGLPAAVASVQVEVVDVLGRLVGQYKLPVRSGSAHQSLATEQLASTLYLLRLTALDAQGQVQGTLPTQRLTLSR